MAKAKEQKRISATPTYDSLDPRKKRFIDGYIKTGNAYQSAIKAGYSHNTAVASKTNFQKRAPRIKKAIQEKIKEYQILNQEQSLKFIEDTYTDIILNSEKEEVRAMTAEKLAKLKGLLTDNININAQVQSKSAVVSQILDDIEGKGREKKKPDQTE